MTIAYRDDKALPSRSVQNLFRRLEWSDWFTQRDIDWYLQHALYVLSAWDGRRLVGMGVLTGDGRIDVHLDMLIIDVPYQRRVSEQR